MEVRLKFKFDGGLAEGGQLDIYDAGKALEGIARALNITMHAYLNGEVRTRADSATGAKVTVRAPVRGSFIYEASIFVAGAVASGVLYDFIKYTFNEAVGLVLEPEGRSLIKKIEPTMGELPAALEGAMEDIHRPIVRDGDIKLSVTRPRGEVIVEFDSETAKSLTPVRRDLDGPVSGHVTRYNTISGWGRVYDYSEEKVISFYLDPQMNAVERELVTWSLHENNRGEEAKVYFDAVAEVSQVHGKIKRYIVSAVRTIP